MVSLLIFDYLSISTNQTPNLVITLRIWKMIKTLHNELTVSSPQIYAPAPLCMNTSKSYPEPQAFLPINPASYA